ncbi:MAG: hypothetical protein HY738_02705 [Bacteroidia bacterium]|nr:hypothetical protein [Bacteroidia bacterium]
MSNIKLIFILLLPLYLFFTTGLDAQDTILTVDGNAIKAKIIEVQQNMVKYKKYDNLDGPLYSILKTDVFSIKYEDGTKTIFNKQNDSREPEKPEGKKENGPVMDSLNIKKKNSFGFGMGHTYSTTIGIGANLEIGITELIKISGGLGIDFLGGFRYNIGVASYLSPVTKTFRPKILLTYGKNRILYQYMDELFIGEKIKENFYGFTLSFGAAVMPGKSKLNGFDFALHIPLTGGGYRIQKSFYELSPDGETIQHVTAFPFGFSFGYRHRF